MQTHQHPTPNPIAERFTFNMRNRHQGETISDCMANLRRLTEFCGFGGSLDNMLRDRLVCGVNDQRLQQRLLAEGRYHFRSTTAL